MHVLIQVGIGEATGVKCNDNLMGIQLQREKIIHQYILQLHGMLVLNDVNAFIYTILETVMKIFVCMFRDL